MIVSLVAFDEGAGGRKPQAGARDPPAARARRAEEAVEEVLDLRRRDADPGVRHLEDRGRRVAAQADLHPAAVGRVLHGVRQQVVEHAAQVRAVGEQRERVGTGVERHVDAALARRRVDVGDGVAREGAQVERLAVEVERARLGAGHEQEVVDHPVQAAGVAQDDRAVGGGLLDVASPAASSSAKPMIDVSGVRRSCDIDASSSWRARRADSTASWRSSWSPTRRASTFHEPHVLAAELLVRLAREAAEGPVERAVVAAERHAERGGTGRRRRAPCR